MKTATIRYLASHLADAADRAKLTRAQYATLVKSIGWSLTIERPSLQIETFIEMAGLRPALEYGDVVKLGANRKTEYVVIDEDRIGDQSVVLVKANDYEAYRNYGLSEDFKLAIAPERFVRIVKTGKNVRPGGPIRPSRKKKTKKTAKKSPRKRARR